MFRFELNEVIRNNTIYNTIMEFLGSGKGSSKEIIFNNPLSSAINNPFTGESTPSYTIEMYSTKV